MISIGVGYLVDGFFLKCDQCGLNLEESQVNHFQGKVLCEDCCFELMNPPKVCDPLAVSSTLSVRKQLGQTGTQGLTELQKQIYNTVVERGKISREELTSRLNMTPAEMAREFAILRHCELLRAFKEGNIVYFAKFSS
jgi:hypothetical protein